MDYNNNWFKQNSAIEVKILAVNEMFTLLLSNYKDFLVQRSDRCYLEVNKYNLIKKAQGKVNITCTFIYM